MYLDDMDVEENKEVECTPDVGKTIPHTGSSNKRKREDTDQKDSVCLFCFSTLLPCTTFKLFPFHSLLDNSSSV